MSDSLAPSPLSSEPTSVLHISPQQFKIEVELNRESYLDLHLHNPTDRLTAFKVKTTTRDRFLLKPTQDYIRPHETKLCKIVMTKMSEYPDLTNPKNFKSKFLVQSTSVEQEYPDLTQFWRELESRHNPKANEYCYAETKIRCKLQVPAKVRANDAMKRAMAEEQAANATAAVGDSTVSSGGERSMAKETRLDLSSEQPQHSIDVDRRSRQSSDDSLAIASDTLVPHAAPIPAPVAMPAIAPMPVTTAQPPAAVAAATHSAASVPSTATAAPSHALTSAPIISPSLPAVDDSSDWKRKYGELMEFMVNTTAKLESERRERETAEARAANLSERYRGAEERALKAESQLSAAREELSRVAAAHSALLAQRALNDDTDASGDASALRRRNATAAGDSAPSPAALPAATAAAAPLAASSPLTSTLPPSTLDKSPNGANLTLQLWQVALLALVCFVLGRIFG